MENHAPETGANFAPSLGKAIKIARTERGWSRGDLAVRAGLSYSYLTQVENGRKPPSSPVVVRISEALGLRASDLLTRAERIAANDRIPTNVDASEVVFTELRELMDRLSPADRDRLLDLARRLAN